MCLHSFRNFCWFGGILNAIIHEPINTISTLLSGLCFTFFKHTQFMYLFRMWISIFKLEGWNNFRMLFMWPNFKWMWKMPGKNYFSPRRVFDDFDHKLIDQSCGTASLLFKGCKHLLSETLIVAMQMQNLTLQIQFSIFTNNILIHFSICFSFASQLWQTLFFININQHTLEINDFRPDLSLFIFIFSFREKH